MNTRLRSAVAFIGLLALSPQYADAAQYLVTYKGAITAGADSDDIFGYATEILLGRSLRADITYSTAVPMTRRFDMTYDEVSGGESFGTSPVIATAKFTIGSSSFTVSPSFYGDVYTSNAFMSAYGYDDLGNNFQTYIIPSKLGPVNLQTPFFSTGVGDGGGPSTQYSYLIAGNDVIDFDASSVSVAAVPEPATWAMMMVGLGALGLMLRRHRKLTALTL